MNPVTGDGLRPEEELAPDDDYLPDDFRPELPSRRRLRPAQVKLIACLAVIVAALGWIAVRGLTGNLVYYLTPTDISHHKAEVGQRVRLGGFVVPGSVGRDGQLLKFVVTDGSRSMTVIDTGSVPELFKAGQGVVVEGSMGRDGRFHSDTLLVKHNGDYQPPSPGEKPPNSADLSQGD